MEDNVVYDNMLNVYLTDSKNSVLQRNLIYCTPGNALYRKAQAGIGMGDERDYWGNPSSSGNKIVNNLVMGCSRNFYWWTGVGGGGGLVNDLIAHNTFVNSVGEVNFKILEGDHRGTRVENNIILQEDGSPIALVEPAPGTFDGGVDASFVVWLPIALANRSTGIAFDHNLWSKTPPSHVAGPGDVIGDPGLSKAGPTGPGALTADWFKLTDNSPAIDKAVALAEVLEDFFGNSRGESPDIGAHEY
jgi:hypothetical protein